MTDNEDATWELVVRSRKSARYAVIAATVLVTVHVALAIFLRSSATGVFFRPADQVAMVVIGCALGGGALMLTRPRLRVGPSGVAVRNIFGERLIEWDLVQGLSFQSGSLWARVDIPDDEYISVMAVQANDREYAVDAVRQFRHLESKYARAQA